MRYLEVHRHAQRAESGHLSQEGVDLARRVGAGSGPFQLVVTSPAPRAIETAVAMGFAVDEEHPGLKEMGPQVEAEVKWDAGFVAWAQAIKRGGAAAHFAQTQAEIWRSIAQQLPEDGQALIITHGGFIEAGLIACFPEADHSQWGAATGYCEGARICFDGKFFTEVEILKV